MSIPDLDPWAHGPFELIVHAESHRRLGTDFDRRMAIVSFDNAIEVSITSFLNLHPSQRGGREYDRAKVARWLANYHTKLEFVDHFVACECIERGVSTNEIIWFHNLRNELYHSGNGMVPEERSVAGARKAALWVFGALFGVDVEKALAAAVAESSIQNSTPTPVQPPGRSGLRSVETSPTQRLLATFIKLEKAVQAAVRDTARPTQTVAGGVSWLTLVSQDASLADREAFEVAHSVRNALVHGEPVDLPDDELLSLNEHLLRLINALDKRRVAQYSSTVAPSQWTPIRFAGEAVNRRSLTTTDEIREAIPIAAAAAREVAEATPQRWDRGLYTGLPIAIYQNELYEQNRQWHFTDGTLCVLWAVEFPKAKSDYAAHPEYIKGTRTAYNNGRHQAPVPAEPCVGYSTRSDAG